MVLRQKALYKISLNLKVIFLFCHTFVIDWSSWFCLVDSCCYLSIISQVCVE
jgi:hypothetical protein